MFQCIPTHRENIWRRFLRFAAALHEKQASREAHAELTRLFERYGNAVFRAAYACLHNKSDAEDVMQDTFLQYLRTNPVFESAEHEKAWLLRVAMNASKNRRRIPVEPSAGGQSGADASPDRDRRGHGIRFD